MKGTQDVAYRRKEEKPEMSWEKMIVKNRRGDFYEQAGKYQSGYVDEKIL